MQKLIMLTYAQGFAPSSHNDDNDTSLMSNLIFVVLALPRPIECREGNCYQCA